MATTLSLPPSAEVGSFLASLFGLEVDACEAEGLDASLVRACAEYVDEDGHVGGLIACSLKGAAVLGAALTRIPLGAAEDAADEGALTPTLAENAGEVFNIAVNLVPQSFDRRLSFGNATYGEEARSTFAARSNRAEFSSYQLTMQQYGDVLITIGTKG
ncbi:MAG: hypothetical protein ACI93T_001542 [Porticoccaceae bacterium]|jgi:hypothetical protein